MTIAQSDLKWYKSVVVTDTVANGGRMSNNLITTGIKNNIFPDVSQAERIAGMIRHRKVFAKNASSANQILVNPVLHLKSISPAGDRVEMFMGTQTDIEDDLTGTEKKYGAGTLNADVLASETVIEVLLEDATQVIFDTVNPNSIYIGNGVNQEYHHNVSASKLGDVVTLTLDAGDQLSNNYTVLGGTVVASCIYGDITSLKAYADPVTETTAGDGTFDDTTYPIVGDNVGAIEDTLTIDFDLGDAINFTCYSAYFGGAVGVGNVNGDFQPINPDLSLPMCTIPSDGWTGTWQANDTLEIPLHPSAIGIWLKETIPAGTNSYSGDNFFMRFGGESA